MPMLAECVGGPYDGERFPITYGPIFRYPQRPDLLAVYTAPAEASPEPGFFRIGYYELVRGDDGYEYVHKEHPV